MKRSKKFTKILAAVAALLAASLLTACGGAKTTGGNIELKIGVSTGDNDPRNVAAARFAEPV